MTRADPTGVTSAMRASATVVAEPAPSGTRVRVHSDPPLVLRRTAPGVVHLVGVGGGPVAGDHLRLRIRVAADAHLVVGQVAATVALPSPHGLGRSVLHTDVEVGAQGSLVWLGEPTVAARGCDHSSEVRLQLAAGASVWWRDEVIAGRHAEPPGRVRSHLTVHRDDRVLLRSDATVGDERWRSPAVAGGARVSGSVLATGRFAPDAAATDVDTGHVEAAACHLDEDVVLLQALGEDHPRVRRLLGGEGLVAG